MVLMNKYRALFTDKLTRGDLEELQVLFSGTCMMPNTGGIATTCSDSS